MDDGCDFEEVSSTMTMNFMRCKDHGSARPIGGILETGPVELSEVIGSALGVLEHILAESVSHHPGVLLMTERIYRNGGTLDPREKARVAQIIAHQLLLETVAEGKYARPSQVAFLPLDFE